MNGDRVVHAFTQAMDVVRYDRAGKWYLEPQGGGKRQFVTLGQAVEYVRWACDNYEQAGPVTWREHRPGGQAFDAKVREFFHRGGAA